MGIFVAIFIIGIIIYFISYAAKASTSQSGYSSVKRVYRTNSLINNLSNAFNLKSTGREAVGTIDGVKLSIKSVSLGNIRYTKLIIPLYSFNTNNNSSGVNVDAKSRSIFKDLLSILFYEDLTAIDITTDNLNIIIKSSNKNINFWKHIVNTICEKIVNARNKKSLQEYSFNMRMISIIIECNSDDE